MTITDPRNGRFSPRRILPIKHQRAVIRAAGGVIMRHDERGMPEVLVIHRVNRQDWSFPKGKVEAGETVQACALREVEEETGLRCRLEEELPSVSYVDRKGRLKVVRYWAMRSIRGTAGPRNEVDAVRWVPLGVAARILTYEHDRALLQTFAASLRAASLQTV
jgi:8-oxo-dGTP pyrophosphatase MutT (NUDIX family)